ncbi:MAG: aminofutalosine synthase MqnE, partial [Pyrinomonadaceae bacterium]|nr:aminofutalosine synthase MqnE [Pyrinomonadaceae bacterium]
MNFSRDRKLVEITDKVEAQVRLSLADGLALYASDDLPALGKLADTVRRR